MEIDLEQLKSELDDYGFVIIPNLVPKDRADRLASRITEIMSARPDADRRDQGLSAVFNHLTPEDDELFVPTIANPVLLELARHKLGDGFQLCEVGVRWLKPGAPAQGLHADTPVGWFPGHGVPIPDACFVVNSMWMLTDFTRDNGATLLLPFSHHTRRVPRAGVSYKHLVAAEGPAGSLVVFHGSIWHKGGANVTVDRYRVGLSIGYYAAWLDPSVTRWQLMKRSVRDRMPEIVQQMNKHVVEG